jgi:nitroreductase
MAHSLFQSSRSMNKEFNFIFGRRSIRKYVPGDVSEADVTAILEAGMAAPSAVARDPWRFVVVRDQAVRERILEKMPHARMLAQTPVGIIVCGDIEAAHDHQLSFLLQDCSAAIENMLLAAHVLGLGACWLGIHPREERISHVQRVLGLPSNIIPVSGICIGHPGETKEPRTRFNPDYVRYERWQ